MTYLYKPHECNLPYPDMNGAIWECDGDDGCGKVYRCVAPGNPDYAGWRRLGPIGRWLYGVRRTAQQHMGGHEASCQMLQPVPPGFMFDTFSCNCRGIPRVGQGLDDTP